MTVENGGLDEEGWKMRYRLERELDEVYTYEGSVWQKRCEKWVLQGGANTDFFHSVANGRRRKCSIQSLETEEGEISEPSGLRKHKEEYYKQLFGREERGGLGLEGNF
jgi:hypothetical protein